MQLLVVLYVYTYLYRFVHWDVYVTTNLEIPIHKYYYYAISDGIR